MDKGSGLFCKICGRELLKGEKAYIMIDDTVMCESCYDVDFDEYEDDLDCMMRIGDK